MKLKILSILSVAILFLSGCASHQQTVQKLQENRLNSVLALVEGGLESLNDPLAEIEVIVPGGTSIPLGEELIVRHKVREARVPFLVAALNQTDYPIPPSQFVQVLDKLIGPALTLGTAWLSFDFAKDIANASLNVASTAAAREPLVVDPVIVETGP